MNIRNVLKIYTLERQLNPDDIALLNTLRSMNESERELLVESLSPTPQKKATKKANKPASKSGAHCQAELVSGATCNMTASHGIHDPEQKHNYGESHKFLARKSSRASSLQAQIQGRASNGNKPQLCAYEIDGNVCRGTENDGIHDSTMGYRNYHEFVAPAVQAATAEGE